MARFWPRREFQRCAAKHDERIGASRELFSNIVDDEVGHAVKAVSDYLLALLKSRGLFVADRATTMATRCKFREIVTARKSTFLRNQSETQWLVNNRK